MYNLFMANIVLSEWLLQQSPLTVVLGAIIWYLYKELAKEREEKNELSKNFTRVTLLTEKKFSNQSDDVFKKYVMNILSV